MPRKYVYRPEYVEKNPKITHRRCTTCREMCEVKKLENSFTCKVCYIKKHGQKRCKKCGLLKYISEFHKNYQYKDGYLPNCRDCRYPDSEKIKEYNARYYQKRKQYMPKNQQLTEKYKEYSNSDYISKSKEMGRYHSSLRRARKINACPAWVDVEEIRKIYEGCPEGYHVDHIIPLTHDIVCGLHVPWNLQYLPASDNIKKSNKLEISIFK